MATQTVSVPDIGGAEGAEIIEISVAVGDIIEEGQDIVTLETDKASMDVPTSLGGKVTALKISIGDKVSEGDVLLEVEAEGAAPSAVVPENPAELLVVAPPTSSTSGSEVVVTVPDGAEGAEVIELCVVEGDTVEEGDSLVVLETDKASMEVPAPQAGKVVRFIVEQGDQTVEGGAILVLSVAGSSSAVDSAPATPVATSQVLMGSSEEIVIVPEGAEGAEVIEVMVSVGDDVAEGDSLIVLETDKASMEVPALKAGKVVSLAVKQGDKTVEGGTILILAVEDATPTPVSKQSPVVPTSAPVKAGELAVISASQSNDVYAGPAVRKLAREMGVDLTQVSGTNDRSRISKDDVKGYVKQVMIGQKAAPAASSSVAGGSGIPAIPPVDFSQFGEIDMLPMSKIKRLTAASMSRNWLNIPHVTQFDDADITDLEDFRKGLKAEAEKRGVKLTPLPFLLKACAAALVAEPSFNVSMHHDGEHIVQKKYVNIGVAVDSPVGLVVPVIRDVDKKGLWELAAEFMQIIDKARNGKLGPKDMQGGCFTISSLGAMGGQGFTPIVNAPEVAILGVSKAEIKPKWNGSEFVPRNMLPLCLSYDHRAVNGGDAGRFFSYLNSVISDVRRLLL
ncbi:MAG: pyruvate dehydrogenase E2 component (dihydrolipoamide acetyltransferase) [Cellvibrionaceae bacterium]